MLTHKPICHVDTCQRGCTVETGCQGHAMRERAPGLYQAAAERLVAEAAKWGVVITMEQRPLQPLAMGNHETVVTTRRARSAG